MTLDRYGHLLGDDLDGVAVALGKAILNCDAPIAQLAEAADLKSAQCRFESDWGH
jgi:hypothetical protein